MVSRESQEAWNWSLCYARASLFPRACQKSGQAVWSVTLLMLLASRLPQLGSQERRLSRANKIKSGSWESCGFGTSLLVQWRRLRTLNEVGMGSILVPLVGELSSHLSSLSRGAKILHATQHSQKKKKKKNHVASKRSCIPLRKLNFMSNHVDTVAVLQQTSCFSLKRMSQSNHLCFIRQKLEYYHLLWTDTWYNTGLGAELVLPCKTAEAGKLLLISSTFLSSSLPSPSIVESHLLSSALLMTLAHF